MRDYDRGRHLQTDSAINAIHIDMFKCGIEIDYDFVPHAAYDMPLQESRPNGQVIDVNVPNDYDGIIYNVECTPNRVS